MYIQLQITVSDDQGNKLGSGLGIYVDDYIESSSSTIIQPREIAIAIYDDQDNSLGYGSMSYDDYVVYNGGGVRAIVLSGSVTDDQDNTIGEAICVLSDSYGSVGRLYVPPPSNQIENSIFIYISTLMLIAVLFVLVRVLSKIRKEYYA